MASEIVKGLYLGDKDDASNLYCLERLGVTRILTVEATPLPETITNMYETLHVPLTDMPDSNILTELPKGIEFMQKTVPDGGGCLVHCFAGISRSTTFVVAFLMKEERMTLEEALEHVGTRRPAVKPNEGFMKQLKLFESMNCEIDECHSGFRLFKLQVVLPKLLMSGNPENVFTEKQENGSLKVNLVKGTLYRCRKCRVILTQGNDVLPHPRNVQTILWHDYQRPLSTTCAQGVFTLPRPWMKEKLYSGTGAGVERLNCFKCNSRLGCFSLCISVNCSCGAQMPAPAFLINASKVDKCTMIKEVEASL